jgi:hypothetical protein
MQAGGCRFCGLCSRSAYGGEQSAIALGLHAARRTAGEMHPHELGLGNTQLVVEKGKDLRLHVTARHARHVHHR